MNATSIKPLKKSGYNVFISRHIATFFDQSQEPFNTTHTHTQTGAHTHMHTPARMQVMLTYVQPYIQCLTV